MSLASLPVDARRSTARRDPAVGALRSVLVTAILILLAAAVTVYGLSSGLGIPFEALPPVS